MNIAKLVKDLIHKQVWSAGELDRMDVGKLLNLICLQPKITKFNAGKDLKSDYGQVLWFHLTGDWSLFPSLYLMFYTNVPILLSLLLVGATSNVIFTYTCISQEKLIAKDVVAWRLGCFLHMLNLFLMLLIPILVINVKSDHIGVLGATVVTLTYSILFLKLWSYVQVGKGNLDKWLTL